MTVLRRLRYRMSAFNVVLAVLSVVATVGIVALFPGVNLGIRILAAAGVVAIAGILFLVVRWGIAHDRARLGMFAALRGWTVHPRDGGLDRRFTAFPFSAGFNGHSTNILRGPYRFYDCATFAYVVNRPAPQVYRVIMVELGTTIPDFQLLPEDAVAAVAKLSGGQDIKIGHGGFDATWRIVSDDERFVKRVLNPNLVESFGRVSVLGLPIVAEAGALFTWEAGVRGVRRLSRRLDTLIEVIEAIPEEYWTGRKPSQY